MPMIRSMRDRLSQFNLWRSFLFIIFYFLFSSAGAQKLSPWVMQAVRKAGTDHRRATGQGQRMMTVFLQTTEGADEVLLSYGGRKLAQQGDICIAAIPLSQINHLAQHPEIKRIEANERAHATMDTVPQIVNVLPAYQATAQHDVFTGKGVVIGLMDVGFDLTHPNFYDNASLENYRIKAFWDQLSTDTIGSPYIVGRDFIGAEEILAQGCSTDGKTQTHGTHTLGIAAGSGYDSPYRGIAYESDICLVSNAVTQDTIYIDEADYYKYTTATDALGFQYLFDYADKVGKPCVVSFSEGYYPCLDQGDSLFCAYLDRLNAPGHIIVSAAGNEGLNVYYMEKAKGTLEAGSFIQASKEMAEYRIKADGPVTLHLYAYENGSTPSKTLTLASERLKTDSLIADTLFIGQDTCAVSLIRYASTLVNDTIYLLDFEANKVISKFPHIALTAEGSDTRVEIFGSSSCKLNNRDTDSRWNAATTGHNILAPSCFESVICVGSTSHRLGFTNYLGEYRNFSSGKEKGMRSPFSSIGPSIMGITKPDVLAPGDNIVSSYSSFYEEANPKAGDIRSDVAHFDYQGRTYAWNSNAGTSMACPVAAGIIALWLQACPTLTREQVMDIFSRTCQQLDKSLSYPNNLYGYGEIDGYRGLLELLGLSSVKELSTHQSQGVSISSSNGMLHLQFNHLPTSPVSISIYSVNGTLLYQHTQHPTSSEMSIPMPTTATGIYAVQLTSNDKRIAGSKLVRGER